VKLKAPFPYFGGKKAVAELVWNRLGDVRNYIEPFAGSIAVLLLRPHKQKVETINDIDPYISNFWRSVKMDKDAVVNYCDWPVIETDLHARHRYLVLSDDAVEFRRRMRTDPDYYDPKIAGWWVWGQCMWIGAGWCANDPSARATPETNLRPHLSSDGRGQGMQRGPKQEIPSNCAKGVHKKRPAIGDSAGDKGLLQNLPDVSGHRGGTGRGILTSKKPMLSGKGVGKGVHAEGLRDGCRPQLADQRARGRGIHSNDAMEECEARHEWLSRWLGSLQDRLRSVRTCSGDWKRVCSSPSVTTRIGMTGLFMDPPYKHTVQDGEGDQVKNRDARLYGHDASTVAQECQDYCIERGEDPLMRIALCGLEGEHEQLEKHGWEVVAWKSHGGYGNRSVNGNDNKERERIWFSPHCLSGLTAEAPLFSEQS